MQAGNEVVSEVGRKIAEHERSAMRPQYMPKKGKQPLKRHAVHLLQIQRGHEVSVDTVRQRWIDRAHYGFTKGKNKASDRFVRQDEACREASQN